MGEKWGMDHELTKHSRRGKNPPSQDSGAERSEGLGDEPWLRMGIQGLPRKIEKLLAEMDFGEPDNSCLYRHDLKGHEKGSESF